MDLVVVVEATQKLRLGCKLGKLCCGVRIAGYSLGAWLGTDAHSSIVHATGAPTTRHYFQGFEAQQQT